MYRDRRTFRVSEDHGLVGDPLSGAGSDLFWRESGSGIVEDPELASLLSRRARLKAELKIIQGAPLFEVAIAQQSIRVLNDQIRDREKRLELSDG